MLALQWDLGSRLIPKKMCNCKCNHDYDYFGNVIEHDYLEFLTNIIEYEYDYLKVVDDYSGMLNR